MQCQSQSRKGCKLQMQTNAKSQNADLAKKESSSIQRPKWTLRHVGYSTRAFEAGWAQSERCAGSAHESTMQGDEQPALDALPPVKG